MRIAVPAGVLRDGDLNMGCTEIMSPWGDAIAERGTPVLRVNTPEYLL